MVQKLYEALATAQSEFTQVSYDRTNPHFKSRYATLAAIEMATRPALNENGLAIVQVFRMLPDNNMILVTRLALNLESYIPSKVNAVWRRSLPRPISVDQCVGCNEVISNHLVEEISCFFF
jgi:hypothetical protein